MPSSLDLVLRAGFIERYARWSCSPSRPRQTRQLVQLVPAEAALSLGAILEDARRHAGTWGLVGLVLLVFNGSNLFANMQ
jgi:hypothetical protein